MLLHRPAHETESTSGVAATTAEAKSAGGIDGVVSRMREELAVLPRAQGPAAYAARLGELEVLSAAKVADLLAPGQVLLRLAVAGFGVTLPPP